MGTKRSAAESNDLEVEYDGAIEVILESTPPESGAVAEPIVRSGTYESRASPSLPRTYDEIQDERSTAASEMVVQFAKLSNSKSLARVVRSPRPTEPLEPRAVKLLGFIDGRTPLGIIFTSAEMDEGEAVAVLARLVELGIIAVY